MKINKEESVCLLIDIQERLVPVMHCKEEFISNTRRLIMGVPELDVPIIATQQYSRGLGETVSDISSLISYFTPIEKKSFSCYDEPGFVEALENTDKSTVIICGIESHVCVLQTAVDLKDAGYNPVILFDCISSRTKSNLKLSLERFRYEGIVVAGYESVLFEMTKSADTPFFKSISKIVK